MFKRSRQLFSIVLFFIAIITAGSAFGGTNWQLVFRYDAGSLQLLNVDPIAKTGKTITTPGLNSAPLRVAYRCDWLDAAGQTVFTSSTELPIGIRVPMGDSLPCRWFVPEEGIVVVRLAGPDPSKTGESIRLSQTGVVNRVSADVNLPAPFRKEQQSFSTSSAINKAAPAVGPVNVAKIRDTGPDANRLVIVVLGDGYTADDLATGAFATATATLGSAIEAKSPWDVLFEATNMYRIDIESNESGADNEIQGVYKDTYLNSSFWVNNIERLLALTGDGYYKAVQAANAQVGVGVWDIILVLVNSTKYGGSGGSVAVSSVNSSAPEIVIHELGHTVAGLADEYETPYPGYPAGDFEPNVDYNYSGASLKWLAWVDAGTPLPTPEYSPYLTAVGAFEGARYLSTGIYRPWFNCEMRSLNRPFCPVCKEAHILSFTETVSLTDSQSPASGVATDIDSAGATFTVVPVPLDGLEYVWSLDDVPLEGATTSTFILTPDLMTKLRQTLELTVILNTPLVRATTISKSYSWPVTDLTALCCEGIVGDANYDGSYEPTIADISTIIDHIFISQSPLVCYDEADVNQSGGTDPGPADITISDISALIDHLFISGVALPACF
jgi:hypothetical protein